MDNLLFRNTSIRSGHNEFSWDSFKLERIEQLLEVLRKQQPIVCESYKLIVLLKSGVRNFRNINNLTQAFQQRLLFLPTANRFDIVISTNEPTKDIFQTVLKLVHIFPFTMCMKSRKNDPTTKSSRILQ